MIHHNQMSHIRYSPCQGTVLYGGGSRFFDPGLQCWMLCCRYAIGQSMPSFLPGLSEWLQHQGLPASVLVFLGFIWYELKASEARQVKRIDDLEARQEKRIDDLRADNRALGEKLDRLVERMLPAKQP